MIISVILVAVKETTQVLHETIHMLTATQCAKDQQVCGSSGEMHEKEKKSFCLSLTVLF